MHQVPAKVLLKAGEVLGKLGDKETGLHEDGSHLEPVYRLSPSYSDISLSEVGSHLTFLVTGVNFFGCR